MHPSVDKIANNRKQETKQFKKPSPLEKVPRNEADEEGVKRRCAMEKFVYVTDTSSTASGPPSPKGKALERSPPRISHQTKSPLIINIPP